ncbi:MULTISPECIES: phosphoribosylanthranilate isomerase [unclassified Streptomyces]|uniref:phosphoribosylanthranilate isomerase n=1 Tax=unclassified Streptomyces TaxID=2593676 RepID=UPI00278C75C9|nr:MULTISPECIES: phosphoribosylanthranilate isomerase [unclassified Streptomyces]
MYVKVCGLSREADVDAAVAAGADAVGFVLTASPRQVTPDRARELAAAVPESVTTVAVFRGEPLDEVREAAARAGVTAVQLHGGEPPEAFAALRADGYLVVRATSPDEAAPLVTGAYGEDALIVDSPRPGSGERWDPAALGGTSPGGHWMLAGGLGPGNVGDAVAALRPWGVDVSSGVESARGVKDPALIERFVKAAKEAAG